MKTLTFLERIPRLVWIAGGLILLFGVGLADYATGYELAFSLFYILPIALVTWFTGWELGLFSAVTAAAVWLAAEVMAGAVYSSPIIYLWNSIIRLGFFALTVFSLRMGKALERERALANTDYLTGILNIRSFNILAQREIDRALRYHYPFSMAYIDVDNFKSINDRFGHVTGDKVLFTIANSLKRNLRKTDIVARVGGDEFGVLLPEMGLEGAQIVMSKLYERLREEMKAGNWAITFSIGVMTFVDPPESVPEMLAKVDKVMYSVKNAGKGNINFVLHVAG